MNTPAISLGWRNHFKRFSQFVSRSDRGILALSLLLIIINAVTNTIMIWYAGLPLTAIVESQYQQIPSILLLFGLLTLVNQGSIFASSLNNEWLAYRVVGKIRSYVFYRLLKLGFAKNLGFHRGDQLSRLNDDTMQINQLVVMLPLNLFNHVLTLSFYSVMLFWIDVQLALIAAAMLPVFYFHQRLFAKAKHRSALRLYQNRGRLMAFEENGLNNIRNINSLVAEKDLAQKHKKHFRQFLLQGVKDMGINLGFQATLVVLIYFLALVIIGVGIYFVQNGLLQAGALLSFILYLGYISFPIRELTHLGLSIQNYSAAADRVDELLSSQAFVEDSGRRNIKLTGHIQFKDIGFHYPDGSKVFNHFNVEILPGDKVALVGASGSGKTSLALLLMRFYDPQQGSIHIDNINIKDLSLDCLRRQIDMVWQENFLLQDSIRANLLLANHHATEKQMVAALMQAQAWEFVQDLPKQLDSILSSGEFELSTGQYQRLSLAQALLRQCPIMIFDEFTSAQDSNTEEKILSNLLTALKDKTVITIAHRYATIRDAEKIIYLTENGQAVVGQHQDLLKYEAYRQALEWQTRNKLA